MNWYSTLHITVMSQKECILSSLGYKDSKNATMAKQKQNWSIGL